MYDEDDLLPISALSQLYYCPRRAGLTLLEQQWSDNVYTAEGTVQHRLVHEGGSEARRDVRISRAIRVRSLRLGLVGVIDCLELRLLEGGRGRGIKVDGLAGIWVPVPVEYKHGVTRNEHEYKVQLCAQAMCLEEMLEIQLEEGYLYYAASRRRFAVNFGAGLRRSVEDGAQRLHEMMRTGVTPSAKTSARCRHCSMVDLCGANMTSSRASRYLAEILDALEMEQEPGSSGVNTSLPCRDT